MERLLIVEDESLIRRGLVTMARRSGVPIGEILECKNGAEALALLNAKAVDVMFTDIRMPNMDGLELIRRIHELPEERRPEIVIVSGYDDFNYAVESMRYGSREYILKPVDRERVYSILEKMEKLVSRKKQAKSRLGSFEKISRQQLKYMLLNPDITDDEVGVIKDAFRDLLGGRPYVVFCTNKKAELPAEEAAIQLEKIGSFHVLVLGENGHMEFSKRVLADYYVGVSSPESDLGYFRNAFEEAAEARKYSFFTGKRLVHGSQVAYCDETPFVQRSPQLLARQVGTRGYSELVHTINALIGQAARGKLRPHVFEETVLQLLDIIAEAFRRQEKDGDALSCLRAIYCFDTVDTYRLALLEWLDSVHSRVVVESENFKNRERMEKAVAYIHENYGKSLNMAVVSNQVSMNYSVFSHIFKEYVGKNFVDYLRDVRIAKARELLTETDMRISEIGARVGYENDKYFMKSFKAAVGISPTEFRRIEQMKEGK